MRVLSKIGSLKLQRGDHDQTEDSGGYGFDSALCVPCLREIELRFVAGRFERVAGWRSDESGGDGDGGEWGSSHFGEFRFPDRIL